MIKLAQKQASWYEALVRAMGGQLADNKGDITTRTAKGRKPVHRLLSNIAQEISGVWINPSGCSKKQASELKKVTAAWADRVHTGHLPK
eukprot:3139581-Ditylum_brightwellii.AAC.2